MLKNKKKILTRSLFVGVTLLSLSGCSLFDRKASVSTSGVKI